MNVSDHIMSFLAEYGVKHIFTVSGGGSIFLNDALGRCKDISYICCHHEQAVSMATESYARTNDTLGVSLVTTGPGGTNAITGVVGAWIDSVPTLTISGQVFLDQTINGSGLRQLGIQEINIVDIVKPVTKYSVMVSKPEDVIYEIEKAIFVAKDSRPGPVWVDIPADIQKTIADSIAFRRFEVLRKNNLERDRDKAILNRDFVVPLVEKFRKARRPLVYIGRGVRIADAVGELREFLETTRIPCVTGWNANELLESDFSLNFGRPGMFGQRHANIIVQNADLILIIGSRLSIPQVGYSYEDFGRNAFKIMVDIDQQELDKKTLLLDVRIRADAKEFLQELIYLTGNQKLGYPEWISYCEYVQGKYPLVLEEWKREESLVNSYHFVSLLSDQLTGRDIVVTDMGLAFTGTHQVFKVKKGQRLFTNSGFASMGWGLPAAIGACVADKRKVICLTGDGGFQMTSQELATVAHYRLPIKIFIFNNGGYLTIKQTQEINFSGQLMGCNDDTGISFPDWRKLAAAYEIETMTIETQVGLSDKIRNIIEYDGPVLCELLMDQDQPNIPKMAPKTNEHGEFVSQLFEDLYPFLSSEELADNMYKNWEYNQSTN